MAGELNRLEDRECLESYNQPFQATRRNLILVTSDPSTIGAAFMYATTNSGYCDLTQANLWICDQSASREQHTCSEPCDSIATTKILEEGNNWTPLGVPVAYCLSQPSKKSCRVQLSPYTLASVIAMNAIKALTMLYIVFGLYKKTTDKPLLTNGDAIASFTEFPVAVTENMCLMSKVNVVTHTGLWPSLPQRFSKKAFPFHSVVSGIRRWICPPL